jgi:hypothetical protein
VRLALSLSALPSKTNEFHKRLSSGDGWSTSAEALLRYYAQQRHFRCLQEFPDPARSKGRKNPLISR